MNKTWNKKIFETHVDFFLAQIKVQWQEGEGRILLGDNAHVANRAHIQGLLQLRYRAHLGVIVTHIHNWYSL